MSLEPNAMLVSAITPKGPAQEAYRAILSDHRVDEDDDFFNIPGGNHEIEHGIMRSNYHDGFQISLPKGTLFFFDLVMSGYGEKISFNELAKLKENLDAWSKAVCEKHHCEYEIFVVIGGG